MKNINFLSEIFLFLVVKFSLYLNRHVFHNVISLSFAELDQRVVNVNQCKKGNNIRHQHGGVHISATVSLVQIYAKVTKSAKCREKITCTKHYHFSTRFHQQWMEFIHTYNYFGYFNKLFINCNCYCIST